jgi:hypothetical protein
MVTRRQHIIGTVVGVGMTMAVADPPYTQAYILDEENAESVFQVGS